MFLLWVIASLLFFPVMFPLLRLACYAAWPFGKEVISRSELMEYKEIIGRRTELTASEEALGDIGAVLNILWLLTFGWILAALHFLAAVVNMLLIWTLVVIPNIMANFKLIPISFMPFNKVIVSTGLADEIRTALQGRKLGLQ
jgi:uncharacterized membrane protein YccF (DUF307 family)